MNNHGPQMPANPFLTQAAFGDLETVAGLFLQAKLSSCISTTIREFRYNLAPLIASCGKQEIGQVGSLQIRKVLNNSRWRRNSQYTVLRTIKELFSWAQANGHLPPDQPTAADSIVVPVYISAPQFLCAEELKEVFGSTQSVGVLLEGALHSFSGLEVADLTGLGWDGIQRKRGIAISRASMSRSRLAPISPAMDAWLLPFYACASGLVCDGASRREFRQWARGHNIYNLSVLLRNSFCVHRLAETGNPGRTASEVGLHPGLLARRFGPAASGVTDTREYFSLTPRKVGLRDWPRMVKEYLAQNSGCRRAEPLRSAAGRVTAKPLAKFQHLKNS